MSNSDDEIPYWVLVSVLLSTIPLDKGLALALHRVALDLIQSGHDVGQVDHRLAHGRVTNVRKEALLGTVGGPVFEAELDTERGSGMVRFILTRQGLDLLEAKAPAKRAMLN